MPIVFSFYLFFDIAFIHAGNPIENQCLVYKRDLFQTA